MTEDRQDAPIRSEARIYCAEFYCWSICPGATWTRFSPTSLQHRGTACLSQFCGIFSAAVSIIIHLDLGRRD